MRVEYAGFTRYKRTTDRMAFTGVYAIVFLFSIAIGYGTLLYGQVSSKLGGARPQAVLLGLSDDARKLLPVPFTAAVTLEGKLIHQTATYIYVESSGRTVRLRTADVIALVTSPEPERQNLQRSPSVQLPPNPTLKGTSADKPASAH